MINIESKYWKIPIVGFIITALMGFFLRIESIIPLLPSFNYLNFLQTHSHLGFIIWIYNAIYLLLCKFIYDITQKSIFNMKMFVAMQIAALIMSYGLLSQGYKAIAIIGLTLHLLLTIIQTKKLFQLTKGINSSDIIFLRFSFVLMLISYLGPLALGPISALGFKYSSYYFSAIYFYLHFQYNGFFIFFLIAYLLYYLKKEKATELIIPQNIINYLFLLQFTSYALSLIFTKISPFINIISFASSISYLLFIRFLWNLNSVKIKAMINEKNRFLLYFILNLIIIKFLSELFSALPLEMQSNRYLIIFYLHLNLLGIVSVLLLKFLYKELSIKSLKLYIFLFSLMEFFYLLFSQGILIEYSSYINVASSGLITLSLLNIFYTLSKTKKSFHFN